MVLSWSLWFIIILQSDPALWTCTDNLVQSWNSSHPLTSFHTFQPNDRVPSCLIIMASHMQTVHHVLCTKHMPDDLFRVQLWCWRPIPNDRQSNVTICPCASVMQGMLWGEPELLHVHVCIHNYIYANMLLFLPIIHILQFLTLPYYSSKCAYYSLIPSDHR